MSRYIDADKLCKGLTEMAKYQEPYKQSTILGVVSTIENTPTADVVEVRHGTWYHGTENGVVYAKCSACGRKMNYSCYGYAYCALCGARMDGKRREE
jgi:hypothetical protein